MPSFLIGVCFGVVLSTILIPSDYEKKVDSQHRAIAVCERLGFDTRITDTKVICIKRGR
jgi:hypothetical protein